MHYHYVYWLYYYNIKMKVLGAKAVLCGMKMDIVLNTKNTIFSCFF